MNISKMFKSFQFAFKGIKLVLNENNFRFHLIATVLVVGAGFYLKVGYSDWLALIICCGFVLTLEILNTAIEKIVDLVSPQKQTLAGQIKDIAAGAVLVASITSVIVMLIILTKYW